MSVTLTVNGMSCGGCESTVVEALQGVAGVESASADHEAGTVTVEGDAEAESLVAAVSGAGYDASA